MGSSGYVTGQYVVKHQPVPFSHEHHVRGLGIDCRYCHTAVERSSFAGHAAHRDLHELPPADLDQRRAAGADPGELPGQHADQWNRVHDLPDFVYFNHRVHVAKGIGCATCHGKVDRMPLMFQNASLQMEWCLDCHRNPAKNVRPREEVFNIDWNPATARAS